MCLPDEVCNNTAHSTALNVTNFVGGEKGEEEEEEEEEGNEGGDEGEWAEEEEEEEEDLWVAAARTMWTIGALTAHRDILCVTLNWTICWSKMRNIMVIMIFDIKKLI